MKTPEYIITVRPDYDFYLEDDEGLALDLADLVDKAGMPIVFPEMDEWGEEMSPIVLASETGQPYEKDWAYYHKRGLEFARKLRRRLSCDYELWYEAPFENKSGTISERIRVEDVFNSVQAEVGGRNNG